jgi:hypothetical protein
VPSAIAKCCGHRLLCAGIHPCIQQFEENGTDHGCYLLWKAALRSVVRALVVLEGRPAMRVAKTLAQSRIESGGRLLRAGCKMQSHWSFKNLWRPQNSLP